MSNQEYVCPRKNCTLMLNLLKFQNSGIFGFYHSVDYHDQYQGCEGMNFEILKTKLKFLHTSDHYAESNFNHVISSRS